MMHKCSLLRNLKAFATKSLSMGTCGCYILVANVMNYQVGPRMLFLFNHFLDLLNNIGLYLEIYLSLLCFSLPFIIFSRMEKVSNWGEKQ
jgi:hypothetical protein